MDSTILVQTQAPPLGTRILRGAVSSFLIGVLTNGFLFVGMSIVIPRALSINEFAQFTVSISFVAMLALLADLGMNPYFTRMFAEAEEHVKSGLEDCRGVLLGSALALRLMMSVIVAGLVWVIGRQMYSQSMVENMSVLLLTLLISSRMLIVRSVGESVLRAEGKYYLAASFALVDAITFASVLLISRGHRLTISSVIWIYTLCNLPGFLLLLATLTFWIRRNKLKLATRFSVIREMLQASVPLALATAFITIHTQIDNLLLDKLSTPMQVSSYGATVRLNSALAPIAIVLALVTAPELTRLLHRGDQARASQLTNLTLRVLLVVSGAIALIMAVLSTDIVILLLGNKYAAAGPLLSWMGWMLIPIFISTYLMEASVAAAKFWFPTVMGAIAMVTVIIGDLLLIPPFGAAGAMGSKISAVTLGTGVLLWLSRGAGYLNVTRFLAALLRIGLAICGALLMYLVFSWLGANRWISCIVILTVYFTVVHASHVLSAQEALSLLQRIRVQKTSGGTG